MATVQKIIDVEANADAVWEKIADVGSISDLIGFITESQLDGEIRICKMADGGVLEERIISVDDALRRVSYCITSSPLGFEFHAASMQVVPNGKRARLVWTTDIKPDSMAEQIDPIFEDAASSMRDSLRSVLN